MANDRAGRRESPFASANRDVRPRTTSRSRDTPRSSAHMRRLHLCASCFSCAPPCCKSRVTLARTDPLLTLPAAEAAANWHMRTPRTRTLTKHRAGTRKRCPLTPFASPPPPPPLPLHLFLRLLLRETHSSRDTGHHLVFTPIHKLGKSSNAGRETPRRIWEASRKVVEPMT